MNTSKKKRKAPPVPSENGHKPQWPSGATYVPKQQTFEEFAKENFVPGTPMRFEQKEIKRPLLVYTPEKERDVSVVSPVFLIINKSFKCLISANQAHSIA